MPSSSGAGGRPVKSKQSRLSKVRASALGERSRDLALSFVVTHASIVADPFVSDAVSAFATGWKAQCVAAFLKISSWLPSGIRPSVTLPAALAGHFAPWSIQARNTATMSSGSLSSFGGISMSGSRCAMNRIIGLSALLPGTIAGP